MSTHTPLPVLPSFPRRFGVLLYGLVSYALFFASYCYAIGFVGGFVVPKSLDSAVTTSFGHALLMNLGLLGVFAVQHSVMARPAFKRWWTRFVPEPMERSTYVLASSVALIALFALWEPMGGTVWLVENPAGRALLYTGFGFGWLLVLVSTFLINHFDLFGLRQVWKFFRGLEYRPLRFVTPGPYRLVRHPLYVGWLCAFWFTPHMTVAHLVFAVMTTAYILIAIQLEERDLRTIHGQDYVNYQNRVPMLIPGTRNRSKNPEPQTV